MYIVITKTFTKKSTQNLVKDILMELKYYGRKYSLSAKESRKGEIEKKRQVMYKKLNIKYQMYSQLYK